MTTPATRSTVSRGSLCGALVVTLVLGACAGGPAPVTRDGPAITLEGRPAIRFENEGATYVDVYLIGQWREGWLGRAAPGALVTLRIPEAADADAAGMMKLAVLAGVPRSLQAARDPRATMTLAQPARSLVARRWTFRQTPLASPELLGGPTDVVRR